MLVLVAVRGVSSSVVVVEGGEVEERKRTASESLVAYIAYLNVNKC